MSSSEIRKISYTQPSITPLEVEFATDAAANGWGEHCYDYIIRFEEAFKTHLGVKYAIATSSCTGDEVIMADTLLNYAGLRAYLLPAVADRAISK